MAGLAALVLLGLALLAAFPWGVLKGRIADRLTRQIGAPVTIADMDRLDRLSLHPVVRLRGVEIAQPAWAGRGSSPRSVRRASRFSVLSLIRGRIAIEALDLSGRGSCSFGGRTGWRIGRAGKPKAGRAVVPRSRA
jgi:hypothetical protein